MSSNAIIKMCLVLIWVIFLNCIDIGEAQEVQNKNSLRGKVLLLVNTNNLLRGKQYVYYVDLSNTKLKKLKVRHSGNIRSIQWLSDGQNFIYNYSYLKDKKKWQSLTWKTLKADLKGDIKEDLSFEGHNISLSPDGENIVYLNSESLGEVTMNLDKFDKITEEDKKEVEEIKKRFEVAGLYDMLQHVYIYNLQESRSKKILNNKDRNLRFEIISWHPDCERVMVDVYAKGNSKALETKWLNINTGETSRIKNEYEHGVFSPNREFVVFLDKDGEISILNREKLEITKTGKKGYRNNFCWTKDSKYIIFVEFEGIKGHKLVIAPRISMINVDGTNYKTLVDIPGVEISDLSLWQP